VKPGDSEGEDEDDEAVDSEEEEVEDGEDDNEGRTIAKTRTRRIVRMTTSRPGIAETSTMSWRMVNAKARRWRIAKTRRAMAKSRRMKTAGATTYVQPPAKDLKRRRAEPRHAKNSKRTRYY
jgi:hypothetical protein